MSIYCRLCLETDRIFVDIYEKQNGKIIADLIYCLLEIKIEQHDQFSKKICDECLEIVVSACELREISVANQKKLPNTELSSIKCEPELIIDFEPKYKKSKVEESREESNEEVVTYCESYQAPQIAPEAHISTQKNNFNEADEEDDLVVETSCERISTRSLTRPKRQKKREELVSACGKCAKAFDQEYLLFAHFNTIHNDVKRPYKCRFCNNQFAKINKLKEHCLIHEMDSLASKFYENGNETAKRRCSVCSKTFEQLKSLISHWNRNHDSTKKPFSCAYCYNREKTEKAITKHVVAVHQELSNDEHVVLVKDKEVKVGPNRMAIFINPKCAANHSPSDQRLIELAIKRIERQAGTSSTSGSVK